MKDRDQREISPAPSCERHHLPLILRLPSTAEVLLLSTSHSRGPPHGRDFETHGLGFQAATCFLSKAPGSCDGGLIVTDGAKEPGGSHRLDR